MGIQDSIKGITDTIGSAAVQSKFLKQQAEANEIAKGQELANAKAENLEAKKAEHFATSNYEGNTSAIIEKALTEEPAKAIKIITMKKDIAKAAEKENIKLSEEEIKEEVANRLLESEQDARSTSQEEAFADYATKKAFGFKKKDLSRAKLEYDKGKMALDNIKEKIEFRNELSFNREIAKTRLKQSNDRLFRAKLNSKE